MNWIKSNKWIVVVLAGVIVVAAAAAGFFLFLYDPLAGSIRRGDVAAAQDYLSKHDAAAYQDKAKTILEKLTKDYEEKKLSYEEAAKQLQVLKAVGLAPFETKAASDRMEQLHHSREAFEQGNTLADQQDYKGALTAYRDVISSPETDAKIGQVKQAYQSELQQRLNDSLAAGDAETVKTVFHDAKTVLADDTEAMAELKKTLFDFANRKEDAEGLSFAIEAIQSVLEDIGKEAGEPVLTQLISKQYELNHKKVVAFVSGLWKRTDQTNLTGMEMTVQEVEDELKTSLTKLPASAVDRFHLNDTKWRWANIMDEDTIKIQDMVRDGWGRVTYRDATVRLDYDSNKMYVTYDYKDGTDGQEQVWLKME